MRRGVLCKAVSAFALAGIIVIGLVFNYLSKPERCFEMTFLSNGIAATALIIGGVALFVRGRDIPNFLYLDATALLLTVLVICGVYAPQVCFFGRSVILHLVSPILTAIFYVVFCKADGGAATAATATILPSLYYLFMIVYGRVTGGYVYPYFDPNLYGGVQLFLIAGIAAAIILAMSFILMFVSAVVHGDLRLRTRKTEARYENN